MNEPAFDTDLIIRFVTGDDPVKQAAVTAFFAQIEQGALQVFAPDTVFADAVFVLSGKVYRLPRQRVRLELLGVLNMKGLRLPNRRILLRALDIFATTRVDFGDAMIVAACERRGSTVLYSYDRDFDRFPQVQRREP